MFKLYIYIIKTCKIIITLLLSFFGSGWSKLILGVSALITQYLGIVLPDVLIYIFVFLFGFIGVVVPFSYFLGFLPIIYKILDVYFENLLKAIAYCSTSLRKVLGWIFEICVGLIRKAWNLKEEKAAIELPGKAVNEQIFDQKILNNDPKINENMEKTKDTLFSESASLSSHNNSSSQSSQSLSSVDMATESESQSVNVNWNVNRYVEDKIPIEIENELKNYRQISEISRTREKKEKVIEKIVSSFEEQEKPNSALMPEEEREAILTDLENKAMWGENYQQDWINEQRSNMNEHIEYLKDKKRRAFELQSQETARETAKRITMELEKSARNQEIELQKYDEACAEEVRVIKCEHERLVMEYERDKLEYERLKLEFESEKTAVEIAQKEKKLQTENENKNSSESTLEVVEAEKIVESSQPDINITKTDIENQILILNSNLEDLKKEVKQRKQDFFKSHTGEKRKIAEELSTKLDKVENMQNEIKSLKNELENLDNPILKKETQDIHKEEKI